jgi:hypothetical protein
MMRSAFALQLSAAGFGAALASADLARASDDAPADPRAVMQASVEKLIELAPGLRSVEVAGFAGPGGHSICATALTDALLVALDEEARNPNRVLRDTPLAVRRARAGAGRPGQAGEAVIAAGQLEMDQRGRAFMSLAFRQGDAVLAPSGRVAVALDRLGCDPTMRAFLDHVAAGARVNREQIDLSAPVFSIGQRLEVAIRLKQPMRLFCWVLAEDGTGFVTLPAGVATGPVNPGVYRYPRDFRLQDVVLANRFENLFGCFGSEEPLPEELAAIWTRLAPAPNQDTVLVDAATVQALMGEMRAQPGVSEAVARVVVR